MARPGLSAAVSVDRFFQFSLVGLVASGYLAVAGSGYLDIPTMTLVAAGLLFRSLLIAGWVRVQLSERAVAIITLAYIAFFVLDYFVLSREFLAATVHLVFFLAVMKILSARTTRDYLYTAVIAFLELLAAAILSISFNFFIFLTLFLLFGIATFMSGEIRRSAHRSVATARGGYRRFSPRLASLAVFVTVAILSITGGLFFVLPRTADAAFAGLMAHRIYLPGFSNQVMLGEIGEVKSTNRPVMHVRLYGDAPPNLKWRGAALAEFDGKRWSNPPGERDALIPVEGGQARLVPPDFRDAHPGRRINYHVDLNAIEADVLFFIGTPEQVSLRYPFVVRTAALDYRVGSVPSQGLSYDAYSLLEEPLASTLLPPVPPVLPLKQRQRYLQLPPLDPRVPALAAQLTEGSLGEQDRAAALERRLRHDYGYSLVLLQREVRDPLANFLFDRRQGHCEYFASAMAVMLRTLGIPARMVTGFQTGVWNPISEMYVIRASDAHSWVEAWIPGRGWTTFDPTPPDTARSLSLFAQAGLYLDAAETFWKEWVVSYDLNRQGALADNVEQGARRAGLRWFDRLGIWSAEWRLDAGRWANFLGWRAGLFSAALLGAALLFRPAWRLLHARRRVRRVRLGRAQAGDATLLYGRMLHLMKRRGHSKPPWFTPDEFVLSLPLGPPRALVAEFTSAYNAVRFGGRMEPAARMSALLEEIQRARE